MCVNYGLIPCMNEGRSQKCQKRTHGPALTANYIYREKLPQQSKVKWKRKCKHEMGTENIAILKDPHVFVDGFC